MKNIALVVLLAGCLPRPEIEYTCKAELTCDGVLEHKLADTCWYFDDGETVDADFAELVTHEAEGRCADVVLVHSNCLPAGDRPMACEI